MLRVYLFLLLLCLGQRCLIDIELNRARLYYSFVPWLLFYSVCYYSVLQPMHGLSICIVHWVYALPPPHPPTPSHFLQRSTTFPLTRHQFIQCFERNCSSSINLTCVWTRNFVGQGTGIVVVVHVREDENTRHRMKHDAFGSGCTLTSFTWILNRML